MHYPPANSELYDMFEARDIAKLNSGQILPVGYREARLGAMETCRRSKGAMTAVICTVLMANDDLCLIRFGPRGGNKCLWNFTTGRAAYS